MESVNGTQCAMNMNLFKEFFARAWESQGMEWNYSSEEAPLKTSTKKQRHYWPDRLNYATYFTLSLAVVGDHGKVRSYITRYLS